MMPPIYTFPNRSHNDILQELSRIMETKGSSVREKWGLLAECLVETDCDAVWKLSKESCENFGFRYPCAAYVTITSIVSDELTAKVEVLSVQHKNMSLPEQVPDVPLIDLWPTIDQREPYVNAETTASFIDLLRFFYNNIWMPWDDQDCATLTSKTIENRMELWSDLQNGSINGRAAQTIKSLRANAIKINEELLELESLFSEDENENDSMLPVNNTIYMCAELNMRLESLKAQWNNLYENPSVRQQYLAEPRNHWQKDTSKTNIVAIWSGGEKAEFEEISKVLNSHLTKNHLLTITSSPNDALPREPDEVIICDAECKFPEIQLSQMSICSLKGATIKAAEMRAFLLVLSESCSLRDLTLECTLVSTVTLLRSGRLLMKNCKLINLQRMDLTQGIVARTGTEVVLENCTFENFFSGLVIQRGAMVELRNCVIRKCGVGIQMFAGSSVKLDGTKIENCTESSICREQSEESEENCAGLHIADNCKIGSGDLNKEIVIVDPTEM